MELSSSQRIHLDREALNQEDFDQRFGRAPDVELSCRENCHHLVRNKCACSTKSFLEGILGFLPFINIMKSYQWKSWLLSDIIAGLSIGVVHIPQSMGFALLAGLPPVYGLYTSFWPPLIYFFLGTSKHISVGTMAVTSLLLAVPVGRSADRFLASDAIAELNSSIPEYNITDRDVLLAEKIQEQEDMVRVATACSVTFMVGIIQILMGIFRLGFVTTFMPKSFISGFNVGAGFHIATSQIPGLLGLKLKRHDGILRLPNTWIEISKNLPNTNLAAMAIGLTCVAVLFIVKSIINEKFKHKLKFPIPADLIVVIFSIVASHFLNVNAKYQVPIVGKIPKGMPTTIPTFDNGTDYIVDAFVISILSFAFSISIAEFFCQKYRYATVPNQEFLAYGIGHLVGSFFGCFVGAAPPARCFVQEKAGGKTQLGSLISCCLILLVLFAIGHLFRELPNAALSAIIIVALFPLIPLFKDPVSFWTINKLDSIIWVITFLSAVILNIDIALGIGILVSVFTVVIQVMAAKGSTLAPVGDSGVYVQATKYQDVSNLRGVCVFRFQSSLYFASIKNFKRQLFAATLDPQVEHNRLTNTAKKQAKLQKDFNENQPQDNGPTLKESGPTPKSAQANSGDYVSCETDSNDNERSQPEVIPEEKVKIIVLDCLPFGYIDVMGVLLLKSLYADFKLVGVTFVLANCGETTLAKLKKAGVVGWSYASDDSDKNEDLIPVFPTVHDAVTSLYSGSPSPEYNTTKL